MTNLMWMTNTHCHLCLDLSLKIKLLIKPGDVCDDMRVMSRQEIFTCKACVDGRYYDKDDQGIIIMSELHVNMSLSLV